jgi:hypothetical protein
VLDTDFNDTPDPDGDGGKYAKYTDDNADDKCRADDNADDNFHVSSAYTPDSYAVSDDKANCGRYFGPSLGSHTLIKKKEEREGERKPELSSASSASSPNGSTCPVQGLLEDPPGWLEKQLSKYQDEPERFLKPTCAAVAQEVFNTVTRWREVEPVLRSWLEAPR